MANSSADLSIKISEDHGCIDDDDFYAWLNVMNILLRDGGDESLLGRMPCVEYNVYCVLKDMSTNFVQV